MTESQDVNVRRVKPGQGGTDATHFPALHRTGAAVSSCNQRDRYYQQDEAAGEYAFGSYKQCLVHPDRRQQDNREVMQTKQGSLILNLIWSCYCLRHITFLLIVAGSRVTLAK